MSIDRSEKRPYSRNARAAHKDEGRETTKKGVGKRNGAGGTATDKVSQALHARCCPSMARLATRLKVAND